MQPKGEKSKTVYFIYCCGCKKNGKQWGQCGWRRKNSSEREGGGLRGSWGRCDGAHSPLKTPGFSSEWSGESLQGFEQKCGRCNTCMCSFIRLFNKDDLPATPLLSQICGRAVVPSLRLWSPRTAVWGAQNRDGHPVPCTEAGVTVLSEGPQESLIDLRFEGGIGLCLNKNILGKEHPVQ